ncbi:hypothetical protein CTI12_AA375010 [Artemisia annua]|uniref:Uncharacterized protein n=1 Tax=Artemisia annua TaxID=35608 RepID=A0A2U1MJ25_ARTAN|nr:hypothetical protein CTI12_AA375010 [Artemisia annua]
MVDALVIVAAEGILNKALSMAANVVSIALGYKEKLTELHDTLNMIRAKLSDAEGKKSTELQLQDEKVEPAGSSYRLGTVPYLDEFKIVGRENDELRIVELLTNSKGDKLTIVPIVGMGGIGKTSLAKSVYNNHKIEQHFEVRTWLCVSVKVNVDKLLANIYESISREKSKSLITVTLMENLREKLGSKRYLLVLDDVWDEELSYWDEFRKCMLQLNSENGSCIIVTTRKLNIRRNANIEDSHILKSLSDDESWAMFKERALPLPELEEIGRDIVKKCCGLPLLVDILGSMLRHYNTDKGKWLSIQESEVWDVEERGRVLSILKLSFDNLPDSMVKQCFVYCSIFKKDKVIDREELVQLWMALGFVTTDTTGTKEMEDLGNDNIQILVNEFPQEMKNLISLRHLVIESHLLPPKDVGLLTSLRTLAYFQVGRQKGRQIEELGPLKHLGGTLRICNLEEIGSKEDAVKADLKRKPNLNMIEYLWNCCDEDANINDKEVLEGLQPPANVKILTVEKFSGDSLPEWAMKMKIKTERNWTPLAKLVEITLTDCHNCLNIPMLEDLPLLQDLVLRNMDNFGYRSILEGAPFFPKSLRH